MNKEKEILNILESFNKSLPFDISTIRSLAIHNEWGEAFDILCTQLYEYDVKVSLEQYTKLKLVGESMSMDNSLWNDLEPDS